MKLIARLSAGMLVLASVSSFADSGYSDMVVFGDSLSDPGNRFILEGNVSVRPYGEGNIPSAPYPIGKGKTFSNGPTWSQVVAQELKLHGGTGPALRTTRFTNYAYGGARASASGGGLFGMSAQVGQYLLDNGGAADPDALYAVWFGANDVRDAVPAFFDAFFATLAGGGSEEDALAAGQAAAGLVIFGAVSNYADNMVTLILAGATEFLVPNVPNLGLAPAVTAQGPEASAVAGQLTLAFNAALADTLNFIEFTFGSNITRMDSFALITEVVDDPGEFGIGNATDACLTPYVTAGAICKSPENYFFWDGVHPTRAGHELVADTALSSLSE